MTGFVRQTPVRSGPYTNRPTTYGADGDADRDPAMIVADNLASNAT
jgi:hypothetical protein